MIRNVLFLLAASTVMVPAQAQFSVYGDLSVVKLSGVSSSPLLQTLSPPPCSGTVTTNCTSFNDSVHPIGFTGGISYDFLSLGPMRLGADARGVIETDKRGAQTDSVGSGTRLYSALGGVKATFNTPFRLVSPYVQASAGYARSNYGVLTNSSVTTSTVRPGIPTRNNVEYHIYAGADLRVLPIVDWRVIELGYGGLESFGTYAHNYPLYSVSTGVVFHFAPRP